MLTEFGRYSWWRHRMETFSALLTLCAGNSPVTGEFPTQRPVTRSFDVFFDLRLNKRLSNQSWGGWFETPLCSLWRHCNVQRNLVWAAHRTPQEDRLLKLALQWRYNELDGLSNHQPIHYPLLTQPFISNADQRKESSASLAFVKGIHRWPVNSPHKWPVTRNIFHLMTSSWTLLVVLLLLERNRGMTRDNAASIYNRYIFLSIGDIYVRV